MSFIMLPDTFSFPCMNAFCALSSCFAIAAAVS